MFTIQEKNRDAFMKALSKMNERYDEYWKCPTGYLEKANYHTRLACQSVHSTREAFTYGVSLLATGDEADLKRAVEVLSHAASLQDKDPSNATYGIWSWYMEEPLDKMSPPDWNWADFCGKEILQALMHHADRLPHETYVELEDTLRNACLSIYRRNMHSGYTNISIMGSYVTLCGGQTLAWPWMFEYGKRRFRKFVEYTRRNGAFAEYNSATYTSVAIEDLTRIQNDIRDEEVREMASEMLDVAWKTVSEHFHAPTKQWCGPNARSYTWLANGSALSFLENALDHRVSLMPEGKEFEYSPAWAYVDIRCPEKYIGAFSHCEPHDVNLGFTSGAFIGAPNDSIAIFHMDKNYTLSSWGVSSTWNQRRNLLGYWGGDKPRFINATILHDLYDFSSGMYVTAQKDGHAVLLATLVSDGGDTHCNLDMIQNETIRAYDLRARIEIGGAVENAWTLSGDTATLEDGGIKLTVSLAGASFDGMPVRLSLSETKDDLAVQNTKADLHRRFVGEEKRLYLDVVFYSGPEKEIKLSALKTAYAALLVSMDGVQFTDASLKTENGRVIASARANGEELSASAPEKPTPRGEWKGTAAQNGVSYNKIYHLPE